jgi:hypothetical protein
METIQDEKAKNIKSFNEIFLEFSKELKEIYPEFEKEIEKTENRINENMQTKYYFDFFFRNILQHMMCISKGDVHELNFNLLPKIKFEQLWFHQNTTYNNKVAILKYLHTFYIILYTKFDLEITFKKYSDDDCIERNKELLENHEDIVRNIIGFKLEDEEEEENFNEDDNENEDDNKNSEEPKIDDKDFEDKFKNTNIGQLAQEISKEINPDDIKNIMESGNPLGDLLSGKMNQNSGLGKVVNTVASKLQQKVQSGQLNEQQLLQEAMGMMGQLGGKGGMPDLSGLFGGGGGKGGMPDLSGLFGGAGGSGGDGKGGGMPDLSGLFNMAQMFGGGSGKKKKKMRRNKHRKH